ncbi:hypothetical protein FKM82_023603 [Ascaphus truei]
MDSLGYAVLRTKFRQADKNIHNLYYIQYVTGFFFFIFFNFYLLLKYHSMVKMFTIIKIFPSPFHIHVFFIFICLNSLTAYVLCHCSTRN